MYPYRLYIQSDIDGALMWSLVKRIRVPVYLYNRQLTNNSPTHKKKNKNPLYLISPITPPSNIKNQQPTVYGRLTYKCKKNRCASPMGYNIGNVMCVEKKNIYWLLLSKCV